MKVKILTSLFLGLLLLPVEILANCSYTYSQLVPLTDLGQQTYKSFQGGLYPGGSNVRPPDHQTAGLAAAGQIQPLDINGLPDANGQIGLVSVGMSNTSLEFDTSGFGSTFTELANSDSTRASQVVVVNGAQGSRVAGCHPEYPEIRPPVGCWTDTQGDVYSTLESRLTEAGVSAAQVQVVWLKQAEARPARYPTDDPTYGDMFHAKVLRDDLVKIAQILKTGTYPGNLLPATQVYFPNLKIIYLSSRTRAYITAAEDSDELNPEPQAYESAFGVKWLIEDYINGTVTGVPFLTWGPYVWIDGLGSDSVAGGVPGRSDGMEWTCVQGDEISDVKADYTHPGGTGVTKVATQLLTFFQTDPTTQSWYLANPPSLIFLIITNWFGIGLCAGLNCDLNFDSMVNSLDFATAVNQ